MWTSYADAPLDEGGVVDEVLVDVELCHVVDDDGAPELLLGVLGLQDVLQQRRLPGAQKPAEQGHGDAVIGSAQRILVEGRNRCIGWDALKGGP